MWITIGLFLAATELNLGALRAVKVDHPAEVPPAAALLLRNAKDDLRELAVRAVSAQTGRGAVAASGAKNVITTAMLEQGVNSDVDAFPEDQYGGTVTVDVTSPPGHNDVLVVVFDIGIPCGGDALFLLFRHKGDSWRLILEERSDDYDSINKGLGSFQWIVSPPNAQGRFLVLTSTVSPWCTSNWQTLRYRVDSIEPSSDRPVPVDEGESDIFDYECDLKADGDSYSLQYQAWSVDSDRLARSYMLNYKVVGDHAVRVDPVADSPRNFVEEWLKMNPDDAVAWSGLDKEEIAMWRNEIGHDNLAFGPLGRCEDGSWQVRLDRSDGEDDEYYDPYYFVVSGPDGFYRLSEINGEHRRDCVDIDESASP